MTSVNFNRQMFKQKHTLFHRSLNKHFLQELAYLLLLPCEKTFMSRVSVSWGPTPTNGTLFSLFIFPNMISLLLLKGFEISWSETEYS